MTDTADIQAVITARDEASTTLQGVSKSVGGLVGQIALGNLAAEAATKSWDYLTETFHEAYDASNNIENSMAQINQVLKTTHDASGQTAESIEKWANALNNVTPISKEAALAGAQVLLQFTNLGKDVFPKVQQATADMAEYLAKGGVVTIDNMTSAAQRLGVALTNPATGFTRLKLAGITFTNAQEEAIKKMQQTNGVGAAQALMLQDLSEKMGGRAVAAGKTFAGTMTVLRDILVDIVERKIVDIIKEGIEDFANFLASHQAVFYGLVGAIGALTAAIVTMVTVAIFQAIAAFTILNTSALLWIGLAAAIGAAVAVMGFVIVKHFKDVKQALSPVILLFKNDLWPVLKAIGGFVANQFTAAWRDLKKAFDQLAATLAPYKSQLEDIAKVLGVVLLAPILIATTALVAFAAVVALVISVLARLIGWVARVVAVIGNFQVNFVKAIANISTSLAAEGKKIIDWFIKLPSTITNTIKNAASWLYETGKNIIRGLINGVKDEIKNIGGAIGKIGSDVGGAVKGALHKIHVPGFAQGGIIPATPGGQLVLVGEGGQDEAIVPLPRNGTTPKLASSGNRSAQNVTINISINAGAFTGSKIDARKHAMEVYKALKDAASSKNTTIAEMMA